ncbi:hypothetical protein GCM10009681_35330 [Luedemannella helvata]|uniref:Uncharacterized protein n=1 Tax=Luedemannella helvata TaxID=349315 RepID=A0ABN2KPM2_9ACTN
MRTLWTLRSGNPLRALDAGTVKCAARPCLPMLWSQVGGVITAGWLLPALGADRRLHSGRDGARHGGVRVGRGEDGLRREPGCQDHGTDPGGNTHMHGTAQWSRIAHKCPQPDG